MKNTKTWSQGMKRYDLYDACWIMGNNPDRAKLIEENPVWSFLPIRYYNYGNWDYAENYHLSSVGHYENGVELCKTSNISSSLGHFARLLWEKAAEIIAREYPGIMDVQFGAQEEDGIYSITFRYDVDEIAAAQRRIMRGLINDGFSIDEYIHVEKAVESEGRISYHYEGVVGCSFEELNRVFHETRHGESLPLVSRKNVQFSYEECEEYYKTFDTRMLTLGNQRRAYRHYEPQNHDLFTAARACDKEELVRMAKAGLSLNEIAPCGNTAFSILLQNLIRKNDLRDITENDVLFLDLISDYNINVNLIGVDECADPPLFEAFINHSERLFSWLSDHGSDKNAEVCYDDYIDKDSSITIQDWINEGNQ